MPRDRVEFEVVGKDTSASKTFRAVGGAADKAANQVDDLGKAADKAGDQVEGLGDKTRTSGEDADKAAPKWAGLAAEIEAAGRRTRELAAEIERTGNLDLAKDLKRQQAEMRKLVRIQDLLPTEEAGEEAGGQLAGAVAVSFAAKLGPLLARVPIAGSVNPVVAAIAAPLAVGVAATVGAAISGAVVGGAVGVGIVGGIKIAAAHPDVKAAAQATGDTISDVLQESAVAFVPATQGALRIVRSEIDGMGDDLERAFSSSSRYLEPLTEDAMSGARRGVEGLATAAERAAPVMEVLGTIAERAGDLVGDSLEDLSEHADEGGRALLLLWGVFEIGARTLVNTIEGLATAYGWMEKFGALLVADIDGLVKMEAQERSTKQSGEGLSEGLQQLIAGFIGAGEEAAQAAVQVESLDSRIRRLADQNIAAAESGARMEEAIDRAAEAAKRNNDGINDNTEAGRQNLLLLTSLAAATRQHAADVLAQTGSQDAANAAAIRGRDAFIRTAVGMGVARAEAERLAAQMFAIPQVVHTKVVAEVRDASGKLTGFEKQVRALDGRVITIRTRFVTSGSKQGEYIPGAGTQLKAEGGRVYGPGSDTSDSVPIRASRDEFVIRAAAARTIGYDVLDQLNQADRRPLGPTPASRSSTRSPQMAGGDDAARALVDMFRRGVTIRLDDPTGRTATLIARGG